MIKTFLKNYIRIVAYQAEKEKYYWNTAVIFTGRDLNKALIRYLENRFVEVARNCNRYHVLTKNTYRNTVLKESQIAVMEEFADKYIDLLQIKTASRETPIKSLSGGNQQKVIIARWLLTNPDYLILDEPTRGIDIGTKTEIQKLVLQLADEGKAVTFISSEIEEMLRTCSRMAVLRDGKKVGEIEEEDLSQESIMKAIAGGDE